MDDSATCFHGSGIYEDCNSRLWARNLMIRYHGNDCRWWHFYPDQTARDLREASIYDLSPRRLKGTTDKC